MSKEDSARTIWASVGITKNLGNYESLRIDAGARQVVDDVTDEAAWTELWKTVQDQIEARLLEADEGLKES